MGSNAAARAGANFGGETGRAALGNCTRSVSPKCGGGRGLPRAVLPCLLSLSPAGLKVKGCSPPTPSLSLSLRLSSSFKESFLCERNACRDHLSYKNKSCGETQQSSSRSQNNQPFPYLFTLARDHGVCRAVNRMEEKCAECASGVSVRLCICQKKLLLVRLKSPDALMWKL